MKDYKNSLYTISIRIEVFVLFIREFLDSYGEVKLSRDVIYMMTLERYVGISLFLVGKEYKYSRAAIGKVSECIK